MGCYHDGIMGEKADYVHDASIHDAGFCLYKRMESTLFGWWATIVHRRLGPRQAVLSGTAIDKASGMRNDYWAPFGFTDMKS